MNEVTQSPLIYSRKEMVKGKLALAKALGKEAEKYFVFFLPFLLDAPRTH